MSELSDYLNEVARERDITGPRPFARAAGVSFGQAQRLLDGTTKPKPETLQRLADNLGLSYDKLRRLNGMRPEVAPFQLPKQFDDLSLKDRRVVLNVGWALWEARFGDPVDDDESSPKRHAPSRSDVVEVDFSQQRVTETVWTPSDSGQDVTHKE